MLAAKERQLTAYHLAWLASVIILVVVMADRGTDANHLIEPLVLGAIILGALWGADGADPSSPIRVVTRDRHPVGWLECLCPPPTGAHTGGRRPSRSRRQLYATDSRHDCSRKFTRELGVLAEDASISVARGDVPVVLDAWVVPKIETVTQSGWRTWQSESTLPSSIM